MRPADLCTAAEATLLLPAAGIAVKLWGVQRTQSYLSARLGAPPAPCSAAAAIEGRRIGRLVNKVGGRWPWRANCLRRSLVVWWLLRRKGIAADLRIGVRPTGAVPDFHAWVEVGGSVVNDRADIKDEFSAFDRPILPRTASFD